MDNKVRYTDSRIPTTPIPSLLSQENVWQQHLRVWAALAGAQSALGLVPPAAATAIAETADLSLLDLDRVRTSTLESGHKIMGLMAEFRRATGEHGKWIHTGATTQNITHTTDSLVLRDVHSIILEQIGHTFAAMATLAEQGKDMPCAGRTHGQHAVPETFGFKVAGWINELDDLLTRLHQAEPRVFTAMLGGAVGHFGSLGPDGPQIQQLMAKQLGLHPMPVPLRSTIAMKVEYVQIMAALASLAFKILNEIETLMRTEYGEVEEPNPPTIIGSSTMPQKINPQLSDQGMATAQQVCAQVTLALQGSMLQVHEVSDAACRMTDDALWTTCRLMGELMSILVVVLSGLKLNPRRMRANLNLTGGLICAEAVMLELAKFIGRPPAHELIFELAQAAAAGEQTFARLLAGDPRVTEHLAPRAIARLLDPVTHVGLSSQMAHTASLRAERLAHQLLKPVSVR